MCCFLFYLFCNTRLHRPCRYPASPAEADTVHGRVRVLGYVPVCIYTRPTMSVHNRLVRTYVLYVLSWALAGLAHVATPTATRQRTRSRTRPAATPSVCAWPCSTPELVVAAAAPKQWSVASAFQRQHGACHYPDEPRVGSTAESSPVPCSSLVPPAGQTRPPGKALWQGGLHPLHPALI